MYVFNTFERILINAKGMSCAGCQKTLSEAMQYGGYEERELLRKVAFPFCANEISGNKRLDCQNCTMNILKTPYYAKDDSINWRIRTHNSKDSVFVFEEHVFIQDTRDKKIMCISKENFEQMVKI